MRVPQQSRRFELASPLLTAALGVGAWFGLVGAAGGADSLLFVILPLAFALVPLLAFAAFRWPIIFPFGLWAGIAPFDYILGDSDNVMSRSVALIAVAMLVTRIISTRRAVRAPSAWFGWLVVVSWMCLTALWTIGPEKTQAALTAIVPLFIMMTVVAVYPVSVIEVRGLLIAIVAGSLTGAALGFNFYAHGLYDGDGRMTLIGAGGSIVDPNFFATSFLLPISICLSFTISMRSLWLRLLGSGAILTMVAAIFLSGSRGAFISMSVIFVYFAWKTRARVMLFGMALGIGLVFVLFPTVLHRLSESQTNTNGSGRTYIWDVGKHALGDHNYWLTGAGIGAFPVAYNHALRFVFQPFFQGWSRPAHNVLLGESVELGIFGVALLVFAWYRTYRQASVISRTSPNYPLRLFAEAAILGLFVNALFVDPLLYKYYWLAFMLPLILCNLEQPVAMRRARSLSNQARAIRLRRALLAAPRR